MQLFVDSPLLTLFFCLGVGTAFGKLKIAGITFGPAGALFAALALSAIEPDVALPPIVTSLSLALFCYVVGINAGPSFVATLRSGWAPVVVGMAAMASLAAACLLIGQLMGLDIGTIGGLFAGAGTATAALGAVQEQLSVDGSVPPEPAVGYAIGYPVAVVITILAAIYLIEAGRRRPQPEDLEKVPPLVVRTLELTAPGLTVRAFADRYSAVVSRITRGARTVVARDGADLQPGDLVTVTAREDILGRAADEVGRPAQVEPWFDRSDIDFRRITLSRPDLVGTRVADLDLDERFDAVVSRIRRGDVDVLATPDVRLQMGDRLRVTAPRQRMGEVSDYLGDSERAAGDINPIGLGLGLTIGLLLALVAIPLPGGASLKLGAATGPLVVGVVLGALGRTGRLVWQLPGGVAGTLNQFGLLVFLVGVGSGAGAHMVDALKTSEGIKVLLAAAVVCVIHSVVAIVGLRTVLKYGTARALGGLTGAQLCPGPYAFALSRVHDQRVPIGYAVLFPVMMVSKVIVAQLMVVVF